MRTRKPTAQRKVSISVDIVVLEKVSSEIAVSISDRQVSISVECIFSRKLQAGTPLSTFRVHAFKILIAKRVAKVETAIPLETSS